ncbi:hypothetical protein BIU97_07645 [Curtobacterium sp. MCBA15_009]|nr:hypothetical protein BIU97_07645 [Curtobacterium sp. MCBA15_009]
MGNDGERAAAIDTTAGAGDAAETGRPRGDREFAVAMVGTVVGLLVAAVDLFVWFAPDMTTFLTLLVVAAVGTPVAVIVVAVCGAYAPAFRVPRPARRGRHRARGRSAGGVARHDRSLGPTVTRTRAPRPESRGPRWCVVVT